MSKKKYRLPFLTLMLCMIFAMMLSAVASAASVEITNYSNFTYASYFSASYEVASKTGNASASGAAISLDATGVNATSGCNSTPAVASTTTVTLTANETVSVTCTPDNNVIIAPPSEVTKNTDGSQTFIVPAGKELKFSVTAENGTKVEGSVTFSNVEPAVSKVPSDCAAYSYNGTVYNYLDKAIDAATTNGGTITVTTSGKVYHSSVETDESYASKTFTFNIPSNVNLLLPYASGVSNFDEKPDMSGTSKFYYNTQSVNSQLTVPAGTTINCSGKICVDSQVFADTLYSGCPGGPHGRIVLENGAALNMKSGSTMYCWGYITGVASNSSYTTGTVTAESGSTIYESFQALGWRGGSLMKLWMNSNSAKSFAFSDYALQNIESNLHIDNGATLKFVTSLEGSGTNAQVAGTFAGTSTGFLQMGTTGSVLRTYDPYNNRIKYNLNGTMNVANVEMTLASLGGVDSKNYIFGLNHSMDLVINSGANITMLYDYKIMPGASVTINAGGKATANGKVYIYDTADYVIDGLTYAHHQSYTWLKSIPVPYIAATGYKSDGFGQVWNQGISQISASTPSGKVVVNGELTIASTGGAYTSSNGGKTANKVITGTGTIINNSTATGIVKDQLDEAKTTYANALNGGSKIEDQNKVATPVVGLIKGLSTSATDYRSFTTGTYHGSADGYWYQHTVSTVTDGGEPVQVAQLGNGYAISFDSSNVASGLTKANVSYTFTADGYEVEASNGTLTEENGTYVLTDITEDTVVTLTTPCNHEEYNDVVTAPKCEVAGYTTHTCTSCGYSYTDSETPALEHSFTNYTSDNNAGCVLDGTKTASCDNGCGKKDTVTDVGTQTGHSYTNYVSNNDATCQKDGTKTAECDKGCGGKDTIADPGTKVGHKFTNYVSDNDATCQVDGHKTASCDFGCGNTDTITDEGSKVDHKYTTCTPNNDATCQKNGTETAKCSFNCGAENTREIADSKVEHKYENYVSQSNATCTAAGTLSADCSYGCGEVSTKEDPDAPALGHSYTNYVSDGNATCLTDGTKTAQCDNSCDQSDTQPDADSKLGHRFINYVPNNDAICEVDGTKTAQCERCMETDTVNDDGTALAHSFETYVANTPATCLANATEIATCVRESCEQKDVRDVENTKLTHSYTSYISDGNATCLAEGTKTAQCDHGCNISKTLPDEGSALGHSFTNYVDNGDATCQLGGTKTAQCDRCVETDTQQTEALGHNFTNYISDDNADCTKDGTKTAKCDRCDEKDTLADEGSKLQHNFEVYQHNDDATCSRNATETATCTICNTATDTRTIDNSTVDHIWGEFTSDNNVTCTQDGTKTASCTFGCLTTHTVVDEDNKSKGHAYGEAVFVWSEDGTSAIASVTCTNCAEDEATKVLSAEATVEQISSSNGDCKTVSSVTYTASVTLNGTPYTENKTIEGGLGSHKMTKTDAKDATCTTAGNNEYYTCNVCKKVYKDELGTTETTVAAETNSAVDHAPSAAVRKNEVAATCGQAGSYDSVVKCTACGTELSREQIAVSATGNHNHTPTVTPPTCVADGYTTYTCACGDSYTTNVVSALGHIFINYTANTDGTTETAVCQNTACSETHTRAVVADNNVVVVKPAETPSGEDEVKNAEVTVDKGLITQIQGEKQELQLESDLLDLVFNNKALEKIITDHDDKKTISIGVKNVTPADSTDKLVFDIHLKVDGNKVDHSDFGDGSVTVTIPLDSLNLSDKQTVKVWYVKDGVRQKEMDHTHDRDGKKVHFQTSHFSEYEVEVCEEEVIEKFDFYAAQVIMGNNLDMMFAIPRNAVADWTGHYVVIDREYADGRANDVQTVPFAEWTVNGSYYVVTYKGLAAKEMCDTITLTVYNAENKAVSNPWVDSMRDYAMRRFDQVRTPLEKALFVDMMNYGAEAQLYLKYNTEDLANSRMTDEHKSYASEAKELNSTLSRGDKWYASNLIMESNISFWVAFNGITTNMYATVEFYDHLGNLVTMDISGDEFGKSGSFYYVDINKLVIADARQIITITIYNADGSVYTTCQESIEDYLARRSSISDLYQAIMKFADSAHAYLHRNDK